MHKTFLKPQQFFINTVIPDLKGCGRIILVLVQQICLMKKKIVEFVKSICSTIYEEWYENGIFTIAGDQRKSDQGERKNLATGARLNIGGNGKQYLLAGKRKDDFFEKNEQTEKGVTLLKREVRARHLSNSLPVCVSGHAIL